MNTLRHTSKTRPAQLKKSISTSESSLAPPSGPGTMAHRGRSLSAEAVVLMMVDGGTSGLENSVHHPQYGASIGATAPTPCRTPESVQTGYRTENDWKNIIAGLVVRLVYNQASGVGH